jgi:hypothetical protein
MNQASPGSCVGHDPLVAPFPVALRYRDFT